MKVKFTAILLIVAAAFFPGRVAAQYKQEFKMSVIPSRETSWGRRGRPAIKLVRCVSRRGSLIDLPIPENRGMDAYNNPGFYRQLAKDPERLMAAALDAQLTVIRLAW